MTEPGYIPVRPILNCNAEAAEYLAENGVRVKFDDPKRVMHTKPVVTGVVERQRREAEKWQ